MPKPKTTDCVLHGGPRDGQTVPAIVPLPAVLVLADFVPAGTALQPGLHYLDYVRRGRTRTPDSREYDFRAHA